MGVDEWKPVRERLGVEQSYFSRIMSTGGDTRTIGSGTIQTVIRRMKLRPEFFYDRAEPRTYRDYLRGNYDAWGEWLKTDDGRRSTEIEREILEDWDFKGVTPNSSLYSALWRVLRAELVSGAMDDAVDELLPKKPRK